MKIITPTTAIILIGSGMYMLDFYNFDYLKKNKNYRLVAIVNEDIISLFPKKQKKFFDAIYIASTNIPTSLCHLSFDEVEVFVKRS